MTARWAWLYGSPVYRLTLGGRAPTGLAVLPPDPWPGDAERGALLIQGRFSAAGHTERVDGEPRVGLHAPPAWRQAFHACDWLRDLRAAGGDAGRRQARLLVTGWIEANQGWTPDGWALDVLGNRIAAWTGQHEFFLASADDDLRARVFDSLARQLRHLRRASPGGLAGAELIAVIKGLLYGALCVDPSEPSLERALRLLERELPRQVLADGGHVERSPDRQLQVLRHLIDIRGCLRAAKRAVPESLQHAIDRMTPALRFFRHGDGGLGLFNGSREGEPIQIDTVLGQADARGRPLKSAPHIGFERLAAGRTVVLLDAGAPPPAGLDGHAHAGTLSFEMSVGRERLIVNCGAHPSGGHAWRQALAATAAHSTLTVADTNIASVREAGGFSRRPGDVEANRQDGGAALVDSSHDGYREPFGLIHRRRLYLAEGGEDLRGEDKLEPAGARPPSPRDFAIRFHLHPAVRASRIAGGETVLLRLPGGSTWRLRAAGALVEVEDSIYLGAGEALRHTRQIVLKGTTHTGITSVKWAIRRDSAPTDAAGAGGDTSGPGSASPELPLDLPDSH